MDNSKLPKTVRLFIEDMSHFIFNNNVDEADDIASYILDKYEEVGIFSAYNDFIVDCNNELIQFHDNYGDEGDTALYSENYSHPITLGISFKHKGDIYCVDFYLNEKLDNQVKFDVFKTNEATGSHHGKRCFYHYNRDKDKNKRLVSMRNFDGIHGVKEEGSDNTVSGPRTLYKLFYIYSN